MLSFRAGLSAAAGLSCSLLNMGHVANDNSVFGVTVFVAVIWTFLKPAVK